MKDKTEMLKLTVLSTQYAFFIYQNLNSEIADK